MKHLSRSEYLDKMRGCWLGKAIGGTLGATFEAQRGSFDLDYYPTDVSSGMIPNDDLDLQLVWLNALERYKTEVTAEKLTDYWLCGIIPNWAEYGVGKSNMRLGIPAPASGKLNNRFKDSNGAWIRSEIWACIAPGHPEVAVKYAVEDASADHCDEGVYGEIFTVALESAAFAESDKFKLIDIALSYIPEDCGCAKAVRYIIDLYNSGIDWKKARVELLRAFPDSFGGQLEAYDPEVENGKWGYDAPANIALTLMGWLYAGDDFGRAICITAGCAEDGDCTTGAVGAILGIIMGANAIPAKWKDPIGNEIKTVCINKFSSAVIVPATLDELVFRTVNLTPAFLGNSVNLIGNGEDMFTVFSGDELYARPRKNMDDGSGWEKHYFRDGVEMGYIFRGECPMVKATVEVDDIEIDGTRDIEMKVKLESTFGFCATPLYAEIEWLTPEGISVIGSPRYTAFVNQIHCGKGYSEHGVTLNVDQVTEPVATVYCAISFRGFASRIVIPVTLIWRA